MSTSAKKCGDLALLTILLLSSILIFGNERPSSTFFSPPYSTKHLFVDATCIALFTTTIMVYSCRAIIQSTMTLGRYFSWLRGNEQNRFPLPLKLFVLLQVIGITYGDFLLAFLFVFGREIGANAKQSTIRFIIGSLWACIVVFIVSLIANSISIWIKLTKRDKDGATVKQQADKNDAI